MLCCQFLFMPYAKYAENKDNPDQANIVLEYFCFRLWIFPHLCVLFLRFEHRIQFTETKKFSTVDKEYGSSVDKGVEQDCWRLSSLYCVLF